MGGKEGRGREKSRKKKKGLWEKRNSGLVMYKKNGVIIVISKYCFLETYIKEEARKEEEIKKGKIERQKRLA